MSALPDPTGPHRADGFAERFGAALDEAAPPATVADAEALARDRFGLSATARPLAGERDRNFHLRDSAGREFVLKIAHPAEDRGSLDLQDRALLHLAERDPGLPVPRVLPPSGGDGPVLWEVPGVPARAVRVLSYLPGRPLHAQPGSAAGRRAIGACLARLDRALAGFRHPAEDHDLLWDLKRAARVRPLLDHVPAGRRDLPLRALDRFEARVLPVLPGLRAQLVHNDFNPHNLLAAASEEADDGDDIAGIIDFGDVVRAPAVQDLATAAAYQAGAGPDAPLRVAEMAAGFHAVLPLLPEEADILFDLVAARLALTVAISSWRAARHPDNADYILRNQRRAWDGLEALDAVPPDRARAILRDALASPAPVPR